MSAGIGNGRGGGPIHRLTPERHKAIVEAVAKGMPRKFTAALAGISESSLYRWLATGRAATEDCAESQLWESIKAAESRCMEHCLEIIGEAGINQWQAAAWLLERRHPKHFGRDADVVVRLKKLLKELEAVRDGVGAA